VSIGFGRFIWCILISALLQASGAVELAAQERAGVRCGANPGAEGGPGLTWIPGGQLFCPLIADPKEVRTFASYLRGDFATIANPEPETETNIGAFGLGDDLALLRWSGADPEAGMQLAVAGAVFTQLNLDEPSLDLINVDYVVGLPLTVRRRGLSARMRAYHQSSHLGDEFLLSRQPERENLSFESLELVVSLEIGALRAYGGGEKFFRREPQDLPDHLVHGGVELRPAVFGAGRLVAALDVKAVAEEDWVVAWSARAGFEIARVGDSAGASRVISVTAEFYEGAAPYGQFYREDIQYFGAALHFGT
jgi:hypothetical protein